MAAAGGDLPRRVTVASATPAATAIDNAAYLSSFPDQRSVTPVAATSQAIEDRLGAVRADLPLAVPGRRTHAADLAGGAGIVGQRFVADLSCPAVAVSCRSGHKPEVRAPGRLDLFSDRDGTFSS